MEGLVYLTLDQAKRTHERRSNIAVAELMSILI